MYLWCNIKNYVYVGSSYFLHTYLFLQISNSLKMVDATNKLSRCLHSSCCSNRSKRSTMDPEINFFGNCAQFRNGKTMYYNGSNPFRVWWKHFVIIICTVLLFSWMTQGKYCSTKSPSDCKCCNIFFLQNWIISLSHNKQSHYNPTIPVTSFLYSMIKVLDNF